MMRAIVKMQPLVARALPVLVLLLCVIAYAGSLSGGFLFDDFNNIVDNPALRAILDSSHDWLAVALSSGSGLLRRPLSMLSFGLDISLFGMDPWAFKAVNLAIHLANGVLVFFLSRSLAGRLQRVEGTQPEFVALLATACWLLHPLLVSNVAYVVQRMNLLAAMFTLAGLLCYSNGRSHALAGGKGLGLAFAGLCGFGLLATLSKENGVLIVAYAWVIELTCFRFNAATSNERRLVKGFFWTTITLPLAALVTWLALHPGWLVARYASRDFTLYERLLSEARILCDYILWIFIPNPAWMGLQHDDIAASTGLFNPPTTALAIFFLAALAAAAWLLRKRSPAFAFAIAWFFVGHSMESTILPLEMVFEHRNYLPMAGLLLGVLCATVPWLRARLHPAAGVIAAVTVVITCASLTAKRATTWGDPYTFALTEVRNHPDSSRAQYAAGSAIIVRGANSGQRANAEEQALAYFRRSAQHDPHQITPLTEMLLIEAKRGKVPTGLIDDLTQRLRSVPHYVKANGFLDMLVALSLQPGFATPEDVAKLVEAALANPRFPRKFRAMVMNNYGAYCFNVRHDREAAFSLTSEAAKLQPSDPYFEINLAQIAMAVGKPQVAIQHLLNARKLDVAGGHAKSIRALEQQLGSTRN